MYFKIICWYICKYKKFINIFTYIMYMCTYIYIYIYMYIYAYIYTYLYTYVLQRTYLYTHLYTQIYISTYKYKYVCIINTRGNDLDETSNNWSLSVCEQYTYIYTYACMNIKNNYHICISISKSKVYTGQYSLYTYIYA